LTGAVRDLGRVLVTGSQGFLGSALVVFLRAAGADVLPTDVTGGDRSCDVTRFDAVDRVMRETRFDTVFHCGAVSGPMVLADRPLEIWRINSTGTANVLEAARATGVGRVIFCSTSEVYGRLTGPVDETMLPQPTSVYAASKLAAEHVSLAYRRERGLDVIALRLSWIYGPGRRTPTMLGAILEAALADGEVRFAGHPDDLTHYLQVDDAVAGLLAAGRTVAVDEAVFNITAGAGVPMSHIMEVVAHLRPAARLSLGGARADGVGPTAIDNSLAARVLGFRPVVGLEQGIEATMRALGL